jgi:hypothetical protein
VLDHLDDLYSVSLAMYILCKSYTGMNLDLKSTEWFKNELSKMREKVKDIKQEKPTAAINGTVSIF